MRRRYYEVSGLRYRSGVLHNARIWNALALQYINDVSFRMYVHLDDDDSDWDESL